MLYITHVLPHYELTCQHAIQNYTKTKCEEQTLFWCYCTGDQHSPLSPVNKVLIIVTMNMKALKGTYQYIFDFPTLAEIALPPKNDVAKIPYFSSFRLHF